VEGSWRSFITHALFLVGDDDPKSNLAEAFKAPKVVSSIIPKETIPAEVKKGLHSRNRS
jgi:hypothetical protein